MREFILHLAQQAKQTHTLLNYNELISRLAKASEHHRTSPTNKKTANLN